MKRRDLLKQIGLTIVSPCLLPKAAKTQVYPMVRTWLHHRPQDVPCLCGPEHYEYLQHWEKPKKPISVWDCGAIVMDCQRCGREAGLRWDTWWFTGPRWRLQRFISDEEGGISVITASDADDSPLWKVTRKNRDRLCNERYWRFRRLYGPDWRRIIYFRTVIPPDWVLEGVFKSSGQESQGAAVRLCKRLRNTG